ncbi:hypothetical protein NE237_019694 [Protea cynaroides]|uniref:Uncharacterized protein n=1 Tax=Protea cynaroides TaxID=273540 RepID=A0A9Q0H9S0_9MAGN|nr:hypothetical protein NE237_019694 [Protea cynaroides]
MMEWYYRYLISVGLLFYLFPVKCENPLAPALYVFGDSLVDSGNNNFLKTSNKANYSPYGIDFSVGATGRFTNGNTIADVIAQLLELPMVPPYLGLSEAQKNQILTGVNYGSGSAGILRETGLAGGENLCLEEQVKMFRKTVQSYLPRNFETQDELLRYLSKAIFVVEIGSNDYINNYLKPQLYNSSLIYTPEQFGALLVHQLKQYLTDLYNLGARKFIVFGIGVIGPIGSIPTSVNKQKLRNAREKDKDQLRSNPENGLHRTLQEMITAIITTLQRSSLSSRDDKLSITSTEDENQLVTYFNNGLLVILEELNAMLQGSTFVHIDVYALNYDIVQNPSKYGFSDRSPCCVVGGNGLCIMDVLPCQDRSKYIRWDYFHPTERVTSIFADRCLNFTYDSPCSALNIYQLVEK